jgi:hypothetical protein
MTDNGKDSPESVQNGRRDAGRQYDAVRQVSQFCRAHGRMPDEIWIGANSVSPQDYLATLGAVIEGRKNANDHLSDITFRQGNFTADRYVAEDSPGLWGWVIFPEGFHSRRSSIWRDCRRGH